MNIGLENVVIALAGECDGAKRRDGRGFSRADATEGARLAALAEQGIAWSISDVKRAVEMASRHPHQAAEIICGSDKSALRAVEAALRNKTMPPLNGVVKDEKQQPYNFACSSPGGRMAYLWRMAWISDISALSRDLAKLATFRHGLRRIQVRKAKADTSMGGQKRRLERMEIDVNGTSLPIILAICRKYGFVVDPALRTAIDPLIDRLRKHAAAAWLAPEADGKSTVAVLDLFNKNEAFSAEMKATLRGSYTCDPDDDWNWRVVWNGETSAILRKILAKHDFACDPRMAA
jgi:hypothetical protein